MRLAAFLAARRDIVTRPASCNVQGTAATERAPARIRTSGIPASGSYLEWLTAKRRDGSRTRLRSGGCLMIVIQSECYPVDIGGAGAQDSLDRASGARNVVKAQRDAGIGPVADPLALPLLIAFNPYLIKWLHKGPCLLHFPCGNTGLTDCRQDAEDVLRMPGERSFAIGCIISDTKRHHGEIQHAFHRRAYVDLDSMRILCCCSHDGLVGGRGTNHRSQHPRPEARKNPR